MIVSGEYHAGIEAWECNRVTGMKPKLLAINVERVKLSHIIERMG